MNVGMGVYHKCSNCNSVVYSFSMLKRLGFQHHLFTNLLNSAKQNTTEFSGGCISCEKPYRQVKYETDGYRTTVYIRPTCFQFALKEKDLPLFKNPELEVAKAEKKYSTEAEKLMIEIDDKLAKHQKIMEETNKPIKMMKSKIIGFFIFLICLIIAFVRISFRYAASTGLGKFFLIFLFIILLLAGLFIIFGGQSIFETVKRYFDQL
jgi:hypothetical protein